MPFGHMKTLLTLPLLLGISCSNRQWDLPVEGTFEVAVVRVAPETCTAPTDLVLTAREMKGRHTVGDDGADYSATFTQPNRRATRFCGRKVCEGKGVRWPWSFLEEDDCPISELQLNVCAIDKDGYVGTTAPRGHVWELSSNTAYKGAMEGTIYDTGWRVDDPYAALASPRAATDAAILCPRSQWQFYLKKR